MTVNEMLCKMSSTELTEWKAFYSLESKESKSDNDQKTMINNLAGKQRRR